MDYTIPNQQAYWQASGCAKERCVYLGTSGMRAKGSDPYYIRLRAEEGQHIGRVFLIEWSERWQVTERE